MKLPSLLSAIVATVALAGCKTSAPEMMGNLHHPLDPDSFYLPNAESARIVSVATNGVASASILVLPPKSSAR